MTMRPRDWAEEVNGVLYLTPTNFARATGRSVGNVRYLMSYGNRVRKLKVEYPLVGCPMIPYAELTEFPFTTPGRGRTSVYRYNEEGRPVPLSDEESDRILEGAKG